ncbi:hypothetical protein Tco_0133069 [Tanacetum coccineum]
MSPHYRIPSPFCYSNFDVMDAAVLVLERSPTDATLSNRGVCCRLPTTHKGAFVLGDSHPTRHEASTTGRLVLGFHKQGCVWGPSQQQGAAFGLWFAPAKGALGFVVAAD